MTSFLEEMLGGGEAADRIRDLWNVCCPSPSCTSLAHVAIAHLALLCHSPGRRSTRLVRPQKPSLSRTSIGWSSACRQSSTSDVSSAFLPADLLALFVTYRSDCFGPLFLLSLVYLESPHLLIAALSSPLVSALFLRPPHSSLPHLLLRLNPAHPAPCRAGVDLGPDEGAPGGVRGEGRGREGGREGEGGRTGGEGRGGGWQVGGSVASGGFRASFLASVLHFHHLHVVFSSRRSLTSTRREGFGRSPFVS